MCLQQPLCREKLFEYFGPQCSLVSKTQVKYVVELRFATNEAQSHMTLEFYFIGSTLKNRGMPTMEPEGRYHPVTFGSRSTDRIREELP